MVYVISAFAGRRRGKLGRRQQACRRVPLHRREQPGFRLVVTIRLVVTTGKDDHASAGGSAIGIDVGYSPKRRSSAICRLEGDGAKQPAPMC
jgi:hypothetical protein